MTLCAQLLMNSPRSYPTVHTHIKYWLNTEVCNTFFSPFFFYFLSFLPSFFLSLFLLYPLFFVVALFGVSALHLFSDFCIMICLERKLPWNRSSQKCFTFLHPLLLLATSSPCTHVQLKGKLIVTSSFAHAATIYAWVLKLILYSYHSHIWNHLSLKIWWWSCDHMITCILIMWPCS